MWPEKVDPTLYTCVSTPYFPVFDLQISLLLLFSSVLFCRSQTLPRVCNLLLSRSWQRSRHRRKLSMLFKSDVLARPSLPSTSCVTRLLIASWSTVSVAVFSGIWKDDTVHGVNGERSVQRFNVANVAMLAYVHVKKWFLGHQQPFLGLVFLVFKFIASQKQNKYIPYFPH